MSVTISIQPFESFRDALLELACIEDKIDARIVKSRLDQSLHYDVITRHEYIGLTKELKYIKYRLARKK